MERKCKNRKCQKILPEGYNHRYCENCRNKIAHRVKKIGEGVLVVAVGGVSIKKIIKS